MLIRFCACMIHPLNLAWSRRPNPRTLDDLHQIRTTMIRAILFDADGVVQRPPAQERRAWQELIGAGRDVDEFVAAVFEVEHAALEGGSDFVAGLSRLLVEWHCHGTLKEALAAWTMIEPDAGVTGIVQVLRRSGLTCCLTTNQESHRASYMSVQLGYRDLFDREFYSCRMGIAKPAPAYFRTIVDELDVSPASVLFLDDHEANVSSARKAGLNAVQFLLHSDSLNLTRTLADFGVHVV
jgi:putative hydrolase of the HAD superfamily